MSMDINIQSLAALSPEYIVRFTATDADYISKMVQVNDSVLLYSEIQFFKEKIYEFVKRLLIQVNLFMNENYLFH
jgi:hypothetical protein